VLLAAIATVVVLGVAGITWWSLRDDGDGATATPNAPVVSPGVAEVGDPAPDFELTTLDGDTVRLSDFRGTPVVLNFWASWCTPCRAEFPLLRDRDADADGEFALVGVDTGDIRADGRRFASEQRARWPNGFDVDGSVAKGYGVIGLPQTFFIRADGTIAARVPAELTAETFRDQVARITQPS